MKPNDSFYNLRNTCVDLTKDQAECFDRIAMHMASTHGPMVIKLLIEHGFKLINAQRPKKKKRRK